jgi:hypothetical protein
MIIIKPDRFTKELTKIGLSSVLIISFILITIIMLINARNEYKILRRKIIIYFLNLIIIVIVSIKTIQNIIVLENNSFQFSDNIQILAILVGIIISITYLKDTFDLLTNKYSKNIYQNKIIKCYKCSYSCFSFRRLYENIRLKYNRIKNNYLVLTFQQRIEFVIFLIFYLIIVGPVVYLIMNGDHTILTNKLLITIPLTIKIKVSYLVDMVQNGTVELLKHTLLILISIISVGVLIFTYSEVIKIKKESKNIINWLVNLNARILGQLILSPYLAMVLIVSFDYYFSNDILTEIITTVWIFILLINSILFLFSKIVQLVANKINDYKKAS